MSDFLNETFCYSTRFSWRFHVFFCHISHLIHGNNPSSISKSHCLIFWSFYSSCVCFSWWTITPISSQLIQNINKCKATWEPASQAYLYQLIKMCWQAWSIKFTNCNGSEVLAGKNISFAILFLLNLWQLRFFSFAVQKFSHVQMLQLQYQGNPCPGHLNLGHLPKGNPLLSTEHWGCHIDKLHFSVTKANKLKLWI